VSDQRPIGVFDSGVGGLTVLAEIRDRLPYEHTIYFGDTARVPYGTRDLAEVRWFTFEIINFEVPIIGVIEPGARAAVEETRNRRVGVLATPLTAASGAYRRAVHSLDAGVEVHEQACPEFVPMIECGVVDGPELETVARGYLQPIMERAVDAVVLGCTHYPLISAPINRILGPEVRLISSAGQTALEVGRVLSRRDRLRRPRHIDDEGKATFVCSADPEEFAALGSRFLDQEIEAVVPATVI
jgi:glutamate racemase